MHRLSTALVVLLAAACSENMSTTGQRITCDTDPDTGVILHCQPGDGEGDGDDDTCVDVDEDGDGEPSDDNGGVILHSAPGDDDGDGIDNDEDCDENEGEDGDSTDLPYDIKMKLGDTYSPIQDAFLEKSNTVPTVISVEMDGGTWRMTELQAGTSFAVTQADCDHAGNRAVGRDRIVVTWDAGNNQTESDHLDLRYCD